MRRLPITIFSTLFLLLVISACKKELTSKASGTSSLTIVNGLVGNSYLYMNFNNTLPVGQYFNTLQVVIFGNFYFSNSYNGQQKLALYQLPDTAISKPVYNFDLNLPINTIHTLFLMGTPGHPDQLLTTDELPFHPSTDSVVSVRFVNLSRNNTAIDVNLQGNLVGSETAALTYKSLTGFKNYAAGAAITSYIFEFRDHTSGQVIGTYTLDGINAPGDTQNPNTRRYRDFTLAFLDVSGGNAIDRVLLVNENVQQ